MVNLALTGNEAGEGKHSIATTDDGQTHEAKAARGDTQIKERGLPKPTVLKNDVEDAELLVFVDWKKHFTRGAVTYMSKFMAGNSGTSVESRLRLNYF